MNAELCSGFTLSGGESRTVDVLFMDMDTRDRYLDVLTEWKNTWNRAKLTDQNLQEILMRGQAIPGVDYFSKNHTELLHKALEVIGREYYWESGAYDLKVVVVTSRPEKEFRFDGSFEISEVEVEKLRSNLNKMLVELPEVGFVPHEFVWPKIKWAH